MRRNGIALAILFLGITATSAFAQERLNGGSPAPSVGPSGSPKAPETFGDHDSLTRIGSMEFEPFDSSATYSDLGNSSGTLSRFPTSTTFLQAVAHLPSGALLTGVDLFYCDTNATSGADVGLVVYTGLANGTGNVPIANFGSNGASGGCESVFSDLSTANFTVDNATNQVFMTSSFGALDGTNSISGVVMHYQLQVSPAPGTATFNDVPTTDPAFQFIEALNASGITAGCGGGNFCPDATLTRRQMAVFLAKGLGLQFP